MKKTLAIILTVALLLGAASALAESKGMIYGIYKAGDQTWFIDEGVAAEAAAKEARYDFTYVDAKMSPEEQLGDRPRVRPADHDHGHRVQLRAARRGRVQQVRRALPRV